MRESSQRLLEDSRTERESSSLTVACKLDLARREARVEQRECGGGGSNDQ